jgi:dienelactone hydrolase
LIESKVNEVSMKKLIVAVVIMLTVGASVSAQAQRRDVDIEADDGFLLRGTYFDAGKIAPAILLLHQCNGDKKGYDNLASMLAAAGFNVLTFDSRGFGESASGRYANFRSLMDAVMPKFPEDVAAAHEFVISQPNVNKRLVGAVGASCNVSMAVLLAQRHAEVRALVLLSGPIHEAGKNFVRRSSDVAVFGAASEDDGRAVQDMKEVVSLSQNGASKLLTFKNAGHGVQMFVKEAQLESNIVNWFKGQLKETH